MKQQLVASKTVDDATHNIDVIVEILVGIKVEIDRTDQDCDTIIEKVRDITSREKPNYNESELSLVALSTEVSMADHEIIGTYLREKVSPAIVSLRASVKSFSERCSPSQTGSLAISLSNLRSIPKSN